MTTTVEIGVRVALAVFDITVVIAVKRTAIPMSLLLDT